MRNVNMPLSRTDVSSELSGIAAAAATHPRLVFLLVFLVLFILAQGAVAASPGVEPMAGHGATSGP